MQTQLDFLSASIRPQNNRESEVMIQEQAPHYASQAEVALAHLMNRKSINSGNCFQLLMIVDLRPRIATLIEMGYKISFRLMSRKMKDWYMSEDQIEFNKKLIK